jgi:histidinol dehydrogenase
MINIKRLTTSDADFGARLDALLAFESAQDASVEQTVAAILADVKTRGDAALIEYTRRFDGLRATSMAELELSQNELQAALAGLPAEQRQALEAAAQRVRSYHERQTLESWQYVDDGADACGTLLGQKVTPLDRVGLYVPGGKASYPSSVLMNAIPARVAGVGELIMVVPTPAGEHNPLVLAAAALAGVDRVFTIGGAQAVAALAYGTQTFPRWTRLSVRATPTLPPPSAASSASSASTWSPARRRSSSSATAIPSPTGWPWICSRRPSTTNSRSRS